MLARGIARYPARLRGFAGRPRDAPSFATVFAA